MAKMTNMEKLVAVANKVGKAKPAFNRSIRKEDTSITIDSLKDSIPAKFRNSITPAVVKMLNTLSTDPEEARLISENILTFTTVLTEGRFKLTDYISAVVYNSNKLMGKNNREAYIATFPDRYQKMKDAGKPDKDINRVISFYNQNILVNKVAEKAAIPVWLLNQDIYQHAINTQYEIMVDDSISPKVRSDAANSLLTHLKKPEIKGSDNNTINLDITVNSGLRELESKLSELAGSQLKNIKKDATDLEEITNDALYSGHGEHGEYEEYSEEYSKEYSEEYSEE